MSAVIRHILPSGALALAVLAVAACGPSFNYEGAWAGNRRLILPGVDKYTAYTAGQVTLTIRDMRFDATEGGQPISGTISSSGGGIILHVQTYMMMPLDRVPNGREKHPDIRVTSQENGSILFVDPAAYQGSPVVLTRK